VGGNFAAVAKTRFNLASQFIRRLLDLSRWLRSLCDSRNQPADRTVWTGMCVSQKLEEFRDGAGTARPARRSARLSHFFFLWASTWNWRQNRRAARCCAKRNLFLNQWKRRAVAAPMRASLRTIVITWIRFGWLGQRMAANQVASALRRAVVSVDARSGVNGRPRFASLARQPEPERKKQTDKQSQPSGVGGAGMAGAR